MAWLESGPECEAWLVLNSCETVDELLESLLATEDEPFTPQLQTETKKTEPPRLTQAPEEVGDSDINEGVATTKKQKRQTTCKRKRNTDELRQTACDCEVFLSLLRERQPNPVHVARHAQQSMPGLYSAAIVSTQQVVAWKKIVLNQYLRRRASEKTNEQLRTALSEQAKVIGGLERLLKRSRNVLGMTTPINRSLTDVEGSHYARRVNELMMSASEMFTHVNDILSAVQRRRMQSDLSDVAWGQILPRGETDVRLFSSATHSRHVPCSPKTVADALWKYFAKPRGQSEAYFRERIEASVDSIVKSFHVRWRDAYVVTNHDVILVTRRLRLLDGVEVVVHLADFEAGDDDTPHHGFRTQGWSIVRGTSLSNQWEPAPKFSEVLLKLVSLPVRSGNSATNPVLESRRHDMLPLVKFTLGRHNEGIQRAIDDSMLMPSLQ